MVLGTCLRQMIKKHVYICHNDNIYFGLFLWLIVGQVICFVVMGFDFSFSHKPETFVRPGCYDVSQHFMVR